MIISKGWECLIRKRLFVETHYRLRVSTIRSQPFSSHLRFRNSWHKHLFESRYNTDMPEALQQRFNAAYEKAVSEIKEGEQ